MFCQHEVRFVYCTDTKHVIWRASLELDAFCMVFRAFLMHWFLSQTLQCMQRARCSSCIVVVDCRRRKRTSIANNTAHTRVQKQWQRNNVRFCSGACKKTEIGCPTRICNRRQLFNMWHVHRNFSLSYFLVGNLSIMTVLTNFRPLTSVDAWKRQPAAQPEIRAHC